MLFCTCELNRKSMKQYLDHEMIVGEPVPEFTAWRKTAA